jgi:hypothetical protein
MRPVRISVAYVLGVLLLQARGDRRDLECECLREADVKGDRWMELPQDHVT